MIEEENLWREQAGRRQQHTERSAEESAGRDSRLSRKDPDWELTVLGSLANRSRPSSGRFAGFDQPPNLRR
jgi:hypothetical protein